MKSLTLERRVRLFPAFSRESLSWRTVAPGKVEISVELGNDAMELSTPGELVIEAAPFGAFVPFEPFTRVAVGALDPGERRSVTVRVGRRELDRRSARPLGALARDLGIPVDLVELLWQSEWIGNLNVYFHDAARSAVERHTAFGLRLRPGRPACVMIDIPLSERDRNVETEVSDPSWRADFLPAGLLPVGLLLVRPPDESGSRSLVTARVTRIRDGRTVPVELEFETTRGPVRGLGCVAV
jgi:hypothetical protein